MLAAVAIASRFLRRGEQVVLDEAAHGGQGAVAHSV